MWVDRALGAVVSWHLGVDLVVPVVVVLGRLRLKSGRSSPFHLWLGSFGGRPPVIFVNEGGAIKVDAHGSTRVAQVTTSVVCTGVVASTRAEQLLPVVVMVSGVEIVGAEPSVTRCC